MHRLVKKQLERNFGKHYKLDSFSKELRSFIESINRSYLNFDTEIELLENMIEVNSLELTESNEKLHIEHENRIKGFMEQAPYFVLVIDFAGKIININTYGANLFGMQREFLINQDSRILFSTRENRNILLQIVQDVKSQKNISVNCKFITINKEELILSIIAKEFLTDFYPNILIMARDVTYEEKIKKDLTNALHDAKKANSAKSEFLANMSHELRTPLNAILGFSQLLLIKDDTPENVKDYVEKINISGNNLLSLVNTILDLSKLEANKMSFIGKKFEVYALITAIISMMEPIAKQKNIIIESKNIKNVAVFADEQLLKQVFINLISNAIKFSVSNSVITIEAQINDESSFTTFIISDRGIGIKEIDIPKLFQSFQQIDNEFQKKSQGTGLGLVICKKIIEELHCGKIWIESRFGDGTDVLFTIPKVII